MELYTTETQTLRRYPSVPVMERATTPSIVTDALAASDRRRGAVLLLGNFDGFHAGHRALLEIAHDVAAGCRPVAVMSCEPHPRSFFSREVEPFRLTTARGKVHMLEPHGFDYVFSPKFDADFAGQSPENFVQDILSDRLGVSHVVCGDDFRFGRKRAGDIHDLRALCAEVGIDASVVGTVRHGKERCSSSLIRDMIRSGDIKAANSLLGQPWLIEVCAQPKGDPALHPALCRPAPGTYLVNPPGSDTGARIPARLCADGSIRPVDRRAVLLPGFYEISRRLV